LYFRPDIEFLAEHFTAQVRSIQPVGPYLLGGFCLGGLIAYEVARRLVSGGQEVALLVMVHTVDDLAPLRVRIARRLLLSLMYPTTLVGYVYRRLATPWRGHKRTIPDLREEGERVEEIRRRFHALAVRTLEHYVALPYDGRMILLEGDRSPERFFPGAVWESLVWRGVEVHLIPAANWEELLRGEAVGDRIKECMARVYAETTRHSTLRLKPAART
jgi:thioesterase domain-containing protein